MADRLAAEKPAIRKKIQTRLEAFSPSQREQLSELLSSRLIDWNDEIAQTSPGDTVALYRPLPEEWKLRALEKHLVQLGLKLAYPRVTDASLRKMEFLLADHSQDSHWEIGKYGIWSPKADRPRAAGIRWALVPGLAYDETGGRVGRGAGYYDRWLETHPEVSRVAIAGEFQVIPQLPQEPWDQRLDSLITEKRTLGPFARAP